MRTSPICDPGFLYCSPELKKLFTRGYSIPENCCVDVPCGIGRNTFFLASRFRHVHAVDINENYLKTLEDCRDTYGTPEGALSTQPLNLDHQIPELISTADMIVTIHYYSHFFTRQVMELMKPGAFFYLETPSCSGENYIELPTDRELESLLTKTEVLLLKTNTCRSPGRQAKSVSVKLLIKKPHA